MRSPLCARRRTRPSSSIPPTAAPESAPRSGTRPPAISMRSALVASSPTAGQMPASVAFVRARGFSAREHRHDVGRRPANASSAAGTAGRDRDRADGGVRRGPDAGVRSRQGKRSRRAGPGRLLGHDVRDLAPSDLGRAGLRPRAERRRDRRRCRRRNVVPLLGSRDRTRDERRHRRDPRLSRPWPRRS